MENNNFINTMVEKANQIMQALDNVETKGRQNLVNLAGAMNLIEQLVKMSADQIYRLQTTIEQFKNAVNDIKQADKLEKKVAAAQREKSTKQ